MASAPNASVRLQERMREEVAIVVAAQLAIDDEGSAVRFCTDSARLASELQNDVKLLNSNAAELERALHEGDRDELECEALD